MDSEYHLFVCDTSGQHEPVATFVSNTPFPSFIVGERFDDHGWDRLKGVGIIASEENPVRYTIHSIKTVLWVDNGKNIIQTGLNLEPFLDERSPAFGDKKPTMTWKEALSHENT